MTTSAASFDAEFLSAQQQRLEREKANLESELQRIARKDPKGEDYHAVIEDISRAPDDNAVEEERYEAARSVEQSLEGQLRDVSAALVRINAGTYGSCVKCGQPIGRERLEALPSAATCRAHASLSALRP